MPINHRGKRRKPATFWNYCYSAPPNPIQQTVDKPLLEHLTRTERRILLLMDSDLSYPEIAELHHVSINTIKTHRKNIYTKLGVTSREEAVERAKTLRLL